ncbi:MAG: hypothetical protein KAW84_06225 [Thermoplasmata archaeon]|nr:hypothetical protein [Thermoplasmata archaeon]
MAESGFGARIATWLSGPFRERIWYRYGTYISAVVLLISLVLPLLGIGNDETQRYSLLGMLLFITYWAQYHIESENPGFTALRVAIGVVLLAPLWLPHVDSAYWEPFSTLANLVVSLFLAVVAIALGVSINWTIFYSLDECESYVLLIIWLIGSLLLFAVIGAWTYSIIENQGLNLLNLVAGTFSLGGLVGSAGFLADDLS